jgi:hypothetical protein
MQYFPDCCFCFLFAIAGNQCLLAIFLTWGEFLSFVKLYVFVAQDRCFKKVGQADQQKIFIKVNIIILKSDAI